MATGSTAPEGLAAPDHQGNFGFCTRFAVAKAVANGFMTKAFGNVIRMDFDQNNISTLLVNMHKVVTTLIF